MNDVTPGAKTEVYGHSDGYSASGSRRQRMGASAKVFVAWALLLRLAWRNLWRHPRRTVITASTISIGMVLAIFFVGIGDGSHQAMVRQAIALGPGHLTVQPAGYRTAPRNQLLLTEGLALSSAIKRLALPAVIAPRIELETLASTAYQSEGVKLMGVTVTDPLLQALTRHRPIEGEGLTDNDSQGVWIGHKLAQRLRVKIGGKIVVVAGRQGADALSHLLRVRGIFNSGVSELDRYVMVGALAAARPLVSEDVEKSQSVLTRIAIFLQSDADGSVVQTQIADVIPSVQASEHPGGSEKEVAAVVLPWQAVLPDLVQFIAVDDAGNYVFLSLILVLVIFGIVNTVLMSVLERTREFGLLCALGLRPNFLWCLVLVESLLMGALSCGVGWMLGALVHSWFATQGLDLSGLMASGTSVMGTVMDPVIYPNLSGARVYQITAIVMGATVLSGLYPALKAARVSPLQAMRL